MNEKYQEQNNKANASIQILFNPHQIIHYNKNKMF